MGMPIFVDYYVTHDYGEAASMNFSPHQRSKKMVPEQATTPEQMLQIWLATQDVVNGELYALAIAAIVGIAIFGVAIWQGVLLMNNKTVEPYVGIFVVLGGLVAGLLIFGILWWILLIAFFPGESIGQVTPSDQAIIQVNAAHYSLLAAISYLFYAAVGKLKALGKMKAKEVEPEVQRTVDLDESANILQ